LFLPHELPHVMDPELAREGMRRLKPLSRVAAHLKPELKSNNTRVCVLESAQYMRNQLLRDADWAGMAHSVEIRVPLVDSKLLRTLAPVIPVLGPGVGKTALARSPAVPLREETVIRTKTGFGVPTSAWMDAFATRATHSTIREPDNKGLVSRRWSRIVLNGPGLTQNQLESGAS